ncbi:MAG TPA: hypothetical protein VEH86_03305 [Candidatus Acidoferrum sp.]|nr:hypothetical protein [Candidatus Acidoferrum sp.]
MFKHPNIQINSQTRKPAYDDELLYLRMFKHPKIQILFIAENDLGGGVGDVRMHNIPTLLMNSLVENRPMIGVGACSYVATSQNCT